MNKRPLCILCVLLIAVQVLMEVAGAGKRASVICPFEKNININLSAEGQVYKREKKSEYQVLYLRDTEVSCQNQKNSKWNIVVYDETFCEVSYGNRIIVKGEGMVFEEPRNPGNYNQKFYYEKQGIAAAVWGKSVQKITDETWNIREKLVELREKWHSLLCRVLGEKNGGMLSAMMLGERSDLDREWKELYQVNGIGHLLAISGLHLSVIGMSLYHLLRKTGLTYAGAGITGGIVLGMYVVMTGLSVSAIRAFTMFVLRIGADITGRVYDMMTSLFISAAIIICWRPLYFFDAGFLLSFGAIFAILFMYPFLRKIISIPSKLVDGLCASLSIQLFLFPVTLYFFFEIPLYSLFLNMIVIPLMSWLLGIGFIGYFLYGVLPSVGTTVLKSSKLIFYIYNRMCEKTVGLPCSRIVIGQPEWWQVVLCYVFLMLFLCLMGKEIKKKEQNKKKWSRCGMLVLLACVLLLAVPYHSFRNRLSVTMLDVGQGDGIFIKGPAGVTYFIDGGSSDVKNAGKYRIEPFLKSQGERQLDYVFISHGDADHMNGIEEMLERQRVGIRIKTLVLPEQIVWDENLKALAQKALMYGTKVVVIKAREQIVEGNLKIMCLLPRKTYKGEIGNASSTVLILNYGDFDMLMTGDVEGEGEDALKEIDFSNQIDVLKVAHHGSKNSTGEEVLRSINPKIGLISAGIGNRYGHPHSETLERLKANGVEVYNTQECGAVKMETDGKTIRIRTFLE